MSESRKHSPFRGVGPPNNPAFGFKILLIFEVSMFAGFGKTPLEDSEHICRGINASLQLPRAFT